MPDLKRKLQKLPCPTHGHPANLPRHLTAWVDFFNVVAPYTSENGTLDHVLVSKICDEYGISFSEAFYWLNFILKEVKKRDGGEGERT